MARLLPTQPNPAQPSTASSNSKGSACPLAVVVVSDKKRAGPHRAAWRVGRAEGKGHCEALRVGKLVEAVNNKSVTAE